MDLPGIPPSSPMADLLRRVWQTVREALSITGPIDFTLLWNNPNDPELCKLQGFYSWRQHGIWFFCQLYNGNTLKAFDHLCAAFSLQNKPFYQYYQLRHAIQMQTQPQSLVMSSSSLLWEILYATTRKGLISRAYSVLLSSIQDCTLLKSIACWVTDIGAIDGEQCDMALEVLPAVSV